MHGIVVPLEWLGLGLESLAHRRQETLEGFDGGGGLPPLYTAYRCLVGSGAQRKAALTEAAPFPRPPDELTGFHEEFMMPN